jgi:imidazolonepropionase-like amidohydrolase
VGWWPHAAAPAAAAAFQLEVARAIVDEAHAHGLIVSVHLSGPEGAALALDAGPRTV